MSRMPKLCALLLCLCLLLAGCQNNASEPTLTIPPDLVEPQETSYKTTVAQKGDFERVATSGVRESYPEKIDLFCPYDNLVLAGWSVYEGQMVKEGDVLARFTSESNAIAIAEAEIALQNAYSAYRQGLTSRKTAIQEAEDSLERMSVGTQKTIRKLELEKQRISLEQYQENTEKTLKKQEEALAELQANMSEYLLTAPCDGIVRTVASLDIGAAVSKTTSIVTMAASDTVFYRLSTVPDGVYYGMEVTLQVKNSSREFEGRIVAASTPLPDTMRYNEVYIAVAKEDLVENPAMLLALMRVDYQPDVCLVENTAVYTDDSGSYVLLLEDGLARRRSVQVGGSNMEHTWIAAGLEPGQTIVIN